MAHLGHSRLYRAALLLTCAAILSSCLARSTESTTGSGAPSGPANDPPVTPPGQIPPGQGDPPPGQPGLRALGGDGQVAVTRFAFPSPLALELTNSGGKPVAGMQVTWTSSDTQGGIELSETSTTTDANGQTSITVTGGTIGATESARLIGVTASVQSGGQTFSRTFYETVALSLPSAFFLQSSAVYTVAAGGTLAGAMKIAVLNTTGDSAGLPVPKVAFTVSTIVPSGTDPSTLPAVSCSGGTLMTDLTGEAVCDLVAGAVTGTAQIQVSVGQFVTYDKSSAQVTP